MSEFDETEQNDDEELLERSKTHEPCERDECTLCSMRDCPRHEPLHYHHDGCPACFSDEETQLVFMTVHKKGYPTDCAWHDKISKMVYDDYGGVRTLWNSAWIEYKLYRSQAEKAFAKLRETGHEVEIEKA
jgi:hypothetical protein